MLGWRTGLLELFNLFFNFLANGSFDQSLLAVMGLFTPSLANLAITSILFSLYVVGLYIYRAFFDSLSHIPGSKLAAATLWVEYYYDVVKKGRYTWEIAKMHRRYGR